MKNLNHQLMKLCRQNRDGSFSTQATRSRILDLSANHLHALGYRHMQATSLKPKHVEALIAHWREQGASTGTLKNRLSALRWWAQKVNRKSIIARENAAYGIGSRTYVAGHSKAQVLDQGKLAMIEDAHVRMSVRLQAAFGLRREEAIKFQPAYAMQGDHIQLKANWTKGGRARTVPITNDDQRRLLEEARTLARGGALIPPHLNYVQQLHRYEKQTAKAGLSRLHGLRHAYAQRRYHELTGRRVAEPHILIVERPSFKVMLLIRSETLLFVPAREESMTPIQLKTRARTSRLVPGLCLLFLLFGCTSDSDRADYREHDIATLQALMQQGELSSRQLTQYYLDRIDAIDRNGPKLNSIIEVNPQAIEIAAALDAERQASGPRGRMHGIPVVLKANIDTADLMETTAGSLAMKGHRSATDAFIVARLRAAGAVILGKANLSEWANFRSTNSSSGWSSIGGQTKNPYDLLRNPCGSSSGSAVSVAASLTSVAVGTETNGSIVCPSSVNGIVGIKPTLGLVSRSGIIPIAHSQDTAGPMGRTVMDAAILLTAMVGADPADPVADRFPDLLPDFAANLAGNALEGARIGVFRGHRGAGNDARVDGIVADTIATLELLGAEIVDAVEIDTEGMSDAQREVLYYEFKADLNEYLEISGAPIRSMADIIEFNASHLETVMPFFGQERMLAAQSKGPLSDPEYLEALATSKRIAQAGIDMALGDNNLDALIAPTRGPAWMTDHVSGDHSSGISSSSLAAVSGYASITVPAGDVLGLPIGISFIGADFSDAKLIQFAYALEQAGYVRKPPLTDH